MKKLIDLHLHLDGSLSLKAVKRLAEMQNISLKENDEQLWDKLTVRDTCRDLNEYLQRFDFPCSLLQTEEAIEFAVYNLQEELKSMGLAYAEIRFAPQKHLEKGLTQLQVVEAAVRGLNKSDFNCGLILCCMRGNDNFKENRETIFVAGKFLNRGVCAIDLAGAEALFPTENFKELFVLAKNNNIPFTIHAGEAMGAESVKVAVELGAKRIGHGVRCVENMELVKYIAENNIVLELCPTSNLNTNVYTCLEEYPLKKLLDMGVKVTVNTDNMTVSKTTLKRELELVKNALRLSDREIEKICDNAIFGAFSKSFM